MFSNQLYSLGNSLPVQTHFNATDFLITNLNIKVDFICDKRTLRRKSELSEKEQKDNKEGRDADINHIFGNTIDWDFQQVVDNVGNREHVRLREI
jgi:hypothetical protein